MYMMNYINTVMRLLLILTSHEQGSCTADQILCKTHRTYNGEYALQPVDRERPSDLPVIVTAGIWILFR